MSPRRRDTASERPSTPRIAVAPSATTSPGLKQGAFAIEPPPAGVDLAGVGLLVQTALAARLEFEMFDGVGDETSVAGDAGALQRDVEELAGRPDEGSPRHIFQSPGCSPISSTRARGGPSPGTTCVAFL